MSNMNKMNRFHKTAKYIVAATAAASLMLTSAVPAMAEEAQKEADSQENAVMQLLEGIVTLAGDTITEEEIDQVMENAKALIDSDEMQDLLNSLGELVSEEDLERIGAFFADSVEAGAEGIAGFVEDNLNLEDAQEWLKESGILELLGMDETDTAEVEERAENMAGMANPVEESDQAGVLEQTGVEMKAPEKAENVRYSLIHLADGKILAQMDYEMEGIRYNFRAADSKDVDVKEQDPNQQNDEEDISGLYYEWDVQQDTEAAGCPALFRSCKECSCITWKDAENGKEYSLSAIAEEGKEVPGMQQLTDQVQELQK